jgi:RNA polymerase sigma-70 factor, ECF subfamily
LIDLGSVHDIERAEVQVADLGRRADREFQRLVAEHRPQVLRVALRLCGGRRAEADDLVQDAVERALRAFPRFRPEMRFAPWLIAILNNRFIDLCRRKRRHPTEVELAPEHHPAASIESEPAPLWTRVTAEELRAAVERLEPDFKRVFVMHAAEGKSYEAIAAELGIPRPTVGTRLYRARRQLREALLAIRAASSAEAEHD